jgi:beta-mannosidase
VHEHSQVFYHPGSPWNNGPDTRDPTKGDVHQWNVWHGSQEDYQNWDKLGGRFVSEFGMHALPHLRTIKHFVQGDTSELYPQSRTLEMHNKATGGASRLEHYMIKNIRHDMSLEGYIYASQLMQAECLAAAYQLWRREWRGDSRRYCGGALVWQLNDVYPGISWSIADYFLRPKLAVSVIYVHHIVQCSYAQSQLRTSTMLLSE